MMMGRNPQQIPLHKPDNYSHHQADRMHRLRDSANLGGPWVILETGTV